ncbi:MAG: gliding motility-associated C-terminal domain-containing protein, partial [Bacteroidales bacterium]
RIEEASNILWSTGDTGTMTYITIKEDTVRTSVIATDRFGCREKKTHTAIVSLPQGSIVSSVDTLCFGDELILTVLSSMAERVRWYNGGTDSELHLRPKNTLICYVDLLMADSVGGCANRIYDTIYVKECSNVMMPNAFKLGGFSKEIKPIGIYEPYKNYYFAIYTRNGKLIFESRDFNVGWDGTYKGNWVQPAVYVYYYRESVGNRKLEERGTITVVR